MDLDVLREERKKWLTWKNIRPYQEAIASLPHFEDVEIGLGDCVSVNIQELSSADTHQIQSTAKLMLPWRKGPFRINDLFIDSEWQSQIK